MNGAAARQTSPQVTARGAKSTRRVVINGRFTGRPITGVERFAREVVTALDKLLQEDGTEAEGLRVCMAVPRGTIADLELKSIDVAEVGRLSGYGWEQLELPLFARGDVIVNLCNIAPVFSSRNITCVHDAHVWLIPDNYSVAFRFANRVLQPLSIRRSARWATISQTSSRELVACGAANRPSDAIISNGTEHTGQWSAQRSQLDRALLPQQFAFALASRARSKNMALVYALADRLAGAGIAVVIAGGNNSRVFSDAAERPSTNVIRLGRVSDDDLALLFQSARCFLFPSLHEGFGLPATEAMRLGCPVVASKAPAMPEILGDAAVLCDPHDVDEWAGAVERIATNDAAREQLIAGGRARADKYSWRVGARELLALIKAVQADG